MSGRKLQPTSALSMQCWRRCLTSCSCTSAAYGVLRSQFLEMECSDMRRRVQSRLALEWEGQGACAGSSTSWSFLEPPWRVGAWMWPSNCVPGPALLLACPPYPKQAPAHPCATWNALLPARMLCVGPVEAALVQASTMALSHHLAQVTSIGPRVPAGLGPHTRVNSPIQSSMI